MRTDSEVLDHTGRRRLVDSIIRDRERKAQIRWNPTLDRKALNGLIRQAAKKTFYARHKQIASKESSRHIRDIEALSYILFDDYRGI